MASQQPLALDKTAIGPTAKIEGLGCYDCMKLELEIRYCSFIRVGLDSLNSSV